jgi:cytochrome c biogenesis protein CcmG, thiol:disulfide interchange protein DsbE
MKRLLSPKFLAMALCVAAATSGLGCSSTTEPNPNMLGLKEVLRTEFPTVQGEQESLSSYSDKIVLLHFFASWCAECASEAPTLRNLQNSFAGSDFQIIGVAVDDDPFEAQRFTRQYALPFPVIMDTQGELKHYFSIKDLPVTMFLDRKGVPVTFQDPQTGGHTAKLSGARRWDTEQPVEMIASMIEAQ